MSFLNYEFLVKSTKFQKIWSFDALEIKKTFIGGCHVSHSQISHRIV